MESAKLSICEKTSMALQLICFPKDLGKYFFLSATVFTESMKNALQLLFSRRKKNPMNKLLALLKLNANFVMST